MAQQQYTVGGRSFRTESDYRRALRDEEQIEKLRAEAEQYRDAGDRAALESLRGDAADGKYHFFTLLGQDFADELADMIKRMPEAAKGRKRHTIAQGRGEKTDKRTQAAGRKSTKSADTPAAAVQVSQADVDAELKRQERRRRVIIAVCGIAAAACMCYLLVYSYQAKRTSDTYDELSALREKSADTAGQTDSQPVIHYTTDDTETPEVLEEYKSLLNKNKKLIGWLKIDDTNIDYPVMQTSDNEYYLTHDLNQEYDKNGSIFMDKDCSVVTPSTNLILYGHHMKSGKMFGTLDDYEDESFYEEHKYITFDTIYEKGTWEVMYVFRSRVYSEGEVVFKYYQFIDAQSEVEFDSYMEEMAAMSLYDTGVTAAYGDRLLTLSTCDYQESNGRFVVVAKRCE